MVSISLAGLIRRLRRLSLRGRLRRQLRTAADAGALVASADHAARLVGYLRFPTG